MATRRTQPVVRTTATRKPQAPEAAGGDDALAAYRNKRDFSRTVRTGHAERWHALDGADIAARLAVGNHAWNEYARAARPITAALRKLQRAG